MALALFDLDNTLLNGDSDHAWGLYLAEIGVVDKEEHEQAQDHFYQQYLNGSLDINEFLSFQLKPLHDHKLNDLLKWRATFLETIIKPMLAHDKLTLVDQHRNAGDTLLIITATNDFITRPIADMIGIDTLIATSVERKENGYTGNYLGTPCFQEGKVTLLQEWMSQHDENLLGSAFYSDSYNDLPLLKLVDTAVAVTPDDKLRAHAEQHNWKIID